MLKVKKIDRGGQHMVQFSELEEFGWYLETDFYIHGLSVKYMDYNIEVAKEVLTIVQSESLAQKTDERKLQVVQTAIESYLNEIIEYRNIMRAYETQGEAYIIEHNKITYHVLKNRVISLYDKLLKVFNVRLIIEGKLVSLAWVNRYHQ